MTILLLTTDAYGGHGGIALFNRDLAAALSLKDDVIVVPRVVPHEPEAVPARVTFCREAARGPVAYLRAVARARRARPDLVICGHLNVLPVACALAERPLLVIYGVEAWKPRANRFLNSLLHRCRGVVAISALTRDRFVAWSGYRGPTHVLSNAIRPEHYGVRPRRPDLVRRYGLEDKRVLLTVGRLDAEERWKGFDEVLEVLGDLPPDVVYLIAGGGSDAPRLSQRAGELGVSDRVRLTGLFPEEDKPAIYNLADVYVMPSHGEGLGFVFLEALASGVPVIASKHDGGRDALLGGKLGLLVDPANPSEIRAAILESFERGPRLVRPELDYYAFDRFAARVTNLVENAIG